MAVRGARQNNLRTLRTLHAIVVFTGVRLGKVLARVRAAASRSSSGATDAAPYARRLIDQAGVPDVDVIEAATCRRPPAAAGRAARSRGHPLRRCPAWCGCCTLARRVVTAGAGMLTRGLLRQHTCRGAMPRNAPRHRRGVRGHRGLDGPGPVSDHPRARRRLLARGVGWT
ncbi:hypothetical protein QJS66_15700 [Kocuria rhizophila]|nr:hypothetical protein QJS66_15700 [Kocuria rhizophila]